MMQLLNVEKVTKEILENTEDRTGLIQEAKKRS